MATIRIHIWPTSTARVICALAFVLTSRAGAADNRVEFFETRIRPQLVKHCYQCHSAAAAAKGRLKGDLQLDTREGTRRGGDSGPAVVPGQAEKSLLVSALKHDDFSMPPDEQLPRRVIADFVHWIKQGAVDPRDGKPLERKDLIDWKQARKHWSFRPLSSAPLPDVVGTAQVRTPVDRFIMAKLSEKGLSPTGAADRRTLVRRAYFDLIGLPPTPQEVGRFVNDTSTTAWGELIDRLLENEHYGERWGRHWLDVVRFGESEGASASSNRVRSSAFKYRDAVIRAFNEDMSFDEFVAAQIAGQSSPGSSAPANDLAQFPHLGASLEDSDNPNDKMFHRLDDMVSTTGSAFLGLTVGCARCHDHKIDPIPAEDYYRLTAVFFAQARVNPNAGKRPVPLELTEPHLLAGGSWKRPVRTVKPGFVTVLMRADQRSEDWLTEATKENAGESPSGALDPRAGLARWLTDVERGAGHLLARVIVNRLWQHHFDRGIVKTPNDFGHLGAEPSHPQLLDWLAGELIRNDWHLKPIHRLIMNSATYRQASSDRWIDLDAENQWVWHYRTRRLEAEIIRDNILSVSGALNAKMYGASVNVGGKSTADAERLRRSIYMLSLRFHAHPTLRVFDSVDNFQSIGQRTVSTTPSSALFMLNGAFVWQQAELMAQRIETEAGSEAAHQVNRVYEIAFARPPTTEERTLGIEFLHTASDTDDTRSKPVLVQYCHAILGLNEFIYVR